MFLIAMSAILAIGEIFGALPFPLNLPAPLFNAIGSVFLITFLLRIFELLEKTLDKELLFFDRVQFLIYTIVFVAVLVVGYALIFKRLLGGDKEKEAKKCKE